MDDLASLDWSSLPAGATKSHQSPSNSFNGQSSTAKNTPSAFDFLSNAAPKGGGPSYYMTTPLRGSTPNLNGSSTPDNNGNARLASTIPVRVTPVIHSARAGSPVVKGSNGNGNSNPAALANDAFSNLLSLAPGPSSSSSSVETKTLSLAERQVKMAREKKEREEREREQFAGDGAFWDKFDRAGSTSTFIGVTPGTKNTDNTRSLDLLQPVALAPSRPPSTNNPHGLLAPSSSVSASPVPTKLSPSMGSFWDKNDLLSPSSSAGPTKTSTPVLAAKPAMKSSTKPSTPLDPFDFDALAASVDGLVPTPYHTTNNTSKGNSGMRTPVSDFDFGDRENGTASGSGWGDGDEDDILGDFGMPDLRAVPKEKHARDVHSKGKLRSSSPPPHIVGRLVEMGYSPQDARQALAKTTSGQDVEAAIEILLASTNDKVDENDFTEEEEDEIERERERRRKEEEAERRRKRRAGPSRDSVTTRQDKEDDPYAEHKELILEKAGEIKQWGLSTATSLWNSGKKLLEEQRKVLEASELAGRKGKAVASDGRPRWAAGDDRNGFEPELDWTDRKAGFRDDNEDDDHVLGGTSAKATGRSRAGGASERPPVIATVGRRQDDRRPKQDHADLLGNDGEQAGSSSHKPSNVANGRSVDRSNVQSRSPPAPRINRSLVSATQSQLQSSGTNKAQGNEHFKLGRFTEAEQSYSAAIASLPSGHLILIPLYNNRCATRLKLGDSSGAVADASTVIDLIGPTYHPSKDAPLPPELLAEVKLADAMVKATMKRAQAWEMGEKWQSALEDWEKVMGFDGVMLGSSAATTKNLAAEGARRARSMLDPTEKPNGMSESRPKPKPVPPQKPANTDKSQAVQDLRKANQAIEAEDAQKLAVKDSVDMRLAAWKAGKETNLRALIASLDTVLSEEMMMGGGMKVGMHELITEKQVKIKYMKVIARLHPDKLNISDTTVEQRMLANGVFGALNDAWQAFNS